MRAFFGLLPLFVHREDMKQDSGIIRNGDQGRNVQTHSIGINYASEYWHVPPPGNRLTELADLSDEWLLQRIKW